MFVTGTPKYCYSLYSYRFWGLNTHIDWLISVNLWRQYYVITSECNRVKLIFLSLSNSKAKWKMSYITHTTLWLLIHLCIRMETLDHQIPCQLLALEPRQTMVEQREGISVLFKEIITTIFVFQRLLYCRHSEVYV